MLKKISLLSLLFILIFGSLFTTVNAKNISDPRPSSEAELDGSISIMGKATNGNEETPGEWYIGATPSNLDPAKPVLLFVHGLNSTAQVWWEDSDMYSTAYNAGYQSTFIQLYDAGGQNEDMWDNGQLLADKIQEIFSHFNGRPITVVAHSKGGVDTQTALTYYGANQYVDNVITLSSPHHGSQLADLSYSSSAGWLADLIGAKGDGTYSMQMAEMEAFRNQTDVQPLAYYNDYYTLAGTAWGSMFTSTFYGGMYLSQYGSNDGVVTVDSSRLPGGQELAVGDWTHTEIRSGITFPVFENYLADAQVTNLTSSKEKKKNKNIKTNQWVDGGELKGNNQLSMFVEDGVEEININLMTAKQPESITLVSPSGQEHPASFKSTKLTEGIFVNAINHQTAIKWPESGEWHIEVKAQPDDAYLLLTDYKTDKKFSLNKSIKRNAALDLTYNLKSDSSKVKPQTIETTYHVTASANPIESYTFSKKGNAIQHIKLDQPDQVYNITIEIEGQTRSGETFKRTIIESVKVPGPPHR
ncbi:hypothetical protein E3U55_06815 [Filobacillus milosensis]|uniref:GPI inositol-deacylase PGAP1-like alpha/beta domain-containing protein n=1 Tax=Filobacillus milosensis TaxID=94137 RepID=A0A4Y8IQK3_9BACI|nr:hypothetical protein [Filobacillus milosensis]TFB22946.1 hypothetical protein E3U55_06815 [Filobacillus milosensis]